MKFDIDRDRFWQADPPAAPAAPAAADDPPADQPAPPADPPKGADPPTDPKAADPPADPPAPKTPVGAADPKTPLGDKPGTPKSAAPEKYELKAGDADIDAAVLDLVTPHLKEAGFTNEQAQAAVDLHDRMLRADWDKHEKVIVPGWLEDSKTALGAAYDEGIAGANRLLANHGSPQLRELLDSSGYGAHPEILKFLASIARATAEGKTGGEPPRVEAVKKSREDHFYKGDKAATG